MWTYNPQKYVCPAKTTTVITRKRRRIRLIGPSPSEFDGPEILASNALAFEKKQIEAAGEHYETLMEVYWGIYVEEPNLSEEISEKPSEADEARFKAHKKKKTKSAAGGALTADLYELLGLGHLRWQATYDEIKVAFRQMAKLHHPDKSDNNDDTLFKAIGNAWEILSDPKKRRDYDSADPFDDALPSLDSIETDSDFYRIFGPVFKNNAKWSKKTPVPDLGDANTPYTQVEIFYTFWIRFQTWREFAQLNEYEPETAESREEKRWMERQNAKLQAEMRKQEITRLTKLVDIAYSRDPRILARKDAQKQEKERKKQEKLESMRKAKEEEAARQAALAIQQAQEEAVAKAAAAEAKVAKDKLKKQLRKKRQALRQFGTTHNINFEEIEKLCENLGLEQLDILLQNVENVDSTKEKIQNELELLKLNEEKKLQDEQREKMERAAEMKRKEEEKETAVWTSEELSLLTKALTKFPGGSVNRWESIATYMNHTKTEAEIIAKIRSVKTKDLKEKPPATRELEDSFQKFLKEKKDATVVSSHSIRYDGPGSSVTDEGKSATQETASTATSIPAKSDSNSAPPSSSTSATSTTTITSSPASKKTAAKATAPASPSSPSSSTSTTNAASNVKDWSAADQALLEAALRKYPTSTENRWDVIATAVPGKTKKECMDRFKYLVSIVKGSAKK